MNGAVKAVCAAGVVAALAGCSYSGWPKHKDDRVVTMTHNALTDLRVESVNGSVRVARGEPGLVRVDARLSGPSLDRLADTAIVAERRAEGVFVGVAWAGGARERGEGCDFTIVIPDAAHIVIRTSNDEVIVDNVGTSVDISTSNDEVEVYGVLGSIRVATSNDHVKVRGAEGPVDIRTSNDEIYIELSPYSAGPILAKTSNDDIEVTVGQAFGGELEASTSNGRVRVYGDGVAVRDGGSRTRATLKFDLPGGRSTLATSNSDITIVIDD